MYKRYFTREEFLTLRVFELPNLTHDRIMNEFGKMGFFMTQRVKARLENIPVYQVGDYINISGIIEIIGG